MHTLHTYIHTYIHAYITYIHTYIHTYIIVYDTLFLAVLFPVSFRYVSLPFHNCMRVKCSFLPFRFLLDVSWR